MKNFKLFINNEWIDSADKKTFTTIDPSTGEIIAELAAAGEADVNQACKAARDAFESGLWSGLDGDERAEYLLKAAAILKRRQKEFAEYEAKDTGKPIYETDGVDIPYSIWAFEYFANLAREIQGHVIPINGETGKNIFDFVTYEPYGVVSVISPYNFPLHLLTRSLCPALAAGNTVVCKASSTTPVTTQLLGEVFEEAGFPPGVVNIVSGSGAVAGEALAINREIDIIAFTGSEEVGRRLIELSSKSEIIKKTLLELGGKGAIIVEPDCDMDAALNAVIAGFTFNQGQVCCASTRLLLSEAIYDEFMEKLVEKAKSIKIGPILDPETRMGSLISKSSLEKVETHIKNAIDQGAKLICGGKRYTVPPCDKGAYFLPTILENVSENNCCYREEVFGPVLVVKKYGNIDEAVTMSNDTDYGLGANLFTRNMETAHWISKKLNAGTVWLNMTNGSMMSAPFGGNKNSGLGREYGTIGLHEYLKIKNNMWFMGGEFAW